MHELFNFSEILLIRYQYKGVEKEQPLLNVIAIKDNKPVQELTYFIDFFDHLPVLQKCKELDWTIIEDSKGFLFVNINLFVETHNYFDWRLLSKSPRNINIFDDLRYELHFFNKTQYEFKLDYFLDDKKFRIHNTTVQRFKESYFSVLKAFEKMNKTYNNLIGNMSDSERLEYEIYNG